MNCLKISQQGEIDGSEAPNCGDALKQANGSMHFLKHLESPCPPYHLGACGHVCWPGFCVQHLGQLWSSAIDAILHRNLMLVSLNCTEDLRTWRIWECHWGKLRNDLLTPATCPVAHILPMMQTILLVNMISTIQTFLCLKICQPIPWGEHIHWMCEALSSPQYLRVQRPLHIASADPHSVPALEPPASQAAVRSAPASAWAARWATHPAAAGAARAVAPGAALGAARGAAGDPSRRAAVAHSRWRCGAAGGILDRRRGWQLPLPRPTALQPPGHALRRIRDGGDSSRRRRRTCVAVSCRTAPEPLESGGQHDCSVILTFWALGQTRKCRQEINITELVSTQRGVTGFLSVCSCEDSGALLWEIVGETCQWNSNILAPNLKWITSQDTTCCTW